MSNSEFDLSQTIASLQKILDDFPVISVRSTDPDNTIAWLMTGRSLLHQSIDALKKAEQEGKS